MGKLPDKRLVRCPRCETPLEVSRNAKSTLCPGCHQNVRTEDDAVDTYCARREFFTEGEVTVGKKGVLIAEVRVVRLVVQGEVKGTVQARESVVVAKTGRVYGDIRTPVLSVEAGAQVTGRCEFGPGLAQLRAPEPAVDAGVSAA
ncbi:MAG: polymer-forming cytoskeletal protein [Planctomycetes bacterium]|nr:polymer-forming cytoskeletal protein [Planctomycetota bacterium]